MKKSVIERKNETSRKIKGVRMVVEIQAKPLDQIKDIKFSGSEKQSTWAKSISASFVADAKKAIETAVIRAEEGDMPNRWAYCVLDAAIKTSKIITDSAGDIINNRNQLNISLVHERAVAVYNS